jgi:hypothetical protein
MSRPALFVLLGALAGCLPEVRTGEQLRAELADALAAQDAAPSSDACGPDATKACPGDTAAAAPCSPADADKLTKAGPAEVVRVCASGQSGCKADPGCTNDCIASKFGVSDACAACVGKSAKCADNNCSAQCALGKVANLCNSCLNEKCGKEWVPCLPPK